MYFVPWLPFLLTLLDRHFKARCLEVQEAWLKGRVKNPVTKSISPAKMELNVVSIQIN